MGALLQRTSFSVNVKERLDFSCALMDAKGYLVVNAPHIPVHLGSMGVCVREVKKVLPMKEGDVVTSWLGQDVVVYEVPGHDKGQIALASRDMSWFIAGDLFQGVGTVVIGDDEGDMAEYFRTLEKVITLNPKVVFPSHGIGLGGVNILQNTLDHRRTRENQVMTMHQQGMSVDQMLEEIYEGVSKELAETIYRALH